MSHLPAIDGTATVSPDGSAEVTVGNSHTVIQAGLIEDARAQIITVVTAIATSTRTAQHIQVTEPDANFMLKVDTDGTVTTAAAAPVDDPPSDADTDEIIGDLDAQLRQLARPLADTGEDEPVAREPGDHATPVTHANPPEPAPEPVSSSSTSVTRTRRTATPSAPPVSAPIPAPDVQLAQPTRRSFLQQQRAQQPATKGWRGAVAKVGVRVKPSPAELAERADRHAVAQHWAGPRTIAVVNGKGGAGKTPTTICLASVFARHGGAGVLTWDNNQTRGTLGWRTEQSGHDATLLDLLPRATKLLSAESQSADLASFVHHQPNDRFDVLRSKPSVLASEQRITAEDVSSIHAVAAKYYRLIFIDSGNDETDPLWLQMIEHTDQLVIATTTRDDHAEAGALLLEGLNNRSEHTANLARGAVTVVSQADSKATDKDIARVIDGYSDLTRAAVSIPFDPALVDGVIAFDALRASTKRAWLAAAAAIAGGL